MADKSAIEWTDASWTPIRARNLKTGKIGWHCEHATTGCQFCYSEGFNLRLGTGLPFKPGHRKDIEIFLDEEMLLAPLRWRKPRMIFVCSMTDLFADFVKDEWIDRIFAVMALCPQHTFQVLTKRAERKRDYFSIGVSPHATPRRLMRIEDAMGQFEAGKYNSQIAVKGWPLPNVWLGVSCERQQEADERIPLLLQTPAAVRFISAEPLLGPIDLTRYLLTGWDNSDADWNPRAAAIAAHLDWVIVGGESGPSARPMHPDWARSLRDQCQAASTPFFFKQRGEYSWVNDYEYDTDRIPMLPGNWRDRTDDKFICMRADGSRADGYGGDSAEFLYRVGKKKAGRLLDGREHNEFPSEST